MDNIENNLMIEIDKWQEKKLFLPDVNKSFDKLMKIKERFNDKISLNEIINGKIFFDVGKYFYDKKKFDLMKKYMEKSVELKNFDAIFYLAIYYKNIEPDDFKFLQYCTIGLILEFIQFIELLENFFKSKLIKKQTLFYSVNVDLILYLFLINLDIKNNLFKMHIDELSNSPDVKLFEAKKNFSIKYYNYGLCEKCNNNNLHLILVDTQSLCFDCFIDTQYLLNFRSIVNQLLKFINELSIKKSAKIVDNNDQILNVKNKIEKKEFVKDVFEIEQEIKNYIEKLENQLLEIQKNNSQEYFDIGIDFFLNNNIKLMKQFMSFSFKKNNFEAQIFMNYFELENKNIKFSLGNYFNSNKQKANSVLVYKIGKYYETINNQELKNKYYQISAYLDNPWAKYKLAKQYQITQTNNLIMIKYYMEIISINTSNYSNQIANRIKSVKSKAANNLGLYHMENKEYLLMNKYLTLSSKLGNLDAVENLKKYQGLLENKKIE